MTTIYKIVPATVWAEAEASGRFGGHGIDRDDGFIHLSDADQLRATAERHFRGQRGLVLVAVDSARLGADLRWEPSRGGALFPHLYAPLPLAAVLWVAPLPWTREGFAWPDALDGTLE